MDRQQVTSRDFIPDLRAVRSFDARSFAPAFGPSQDAMNRVTPRQLVPAYLQQKNLIDLSPNFAKSGLSFTPSSYLPAGTGMEQILPSTSFAPSFGPGKGQSGFGLPASQPVTTLDDLMRQYGIGQYKPAPPVPGQPGYSGSMADLGDHPLNSYNQYFAEAGAAEGVDPLLLKAIAYVEHGWDQPVSPKGAVGIMQLMPNWESELGVNRTDPRSNIMGGAKVLNIKRREGDGSWEDAIRRYHGYGYDGYTTDQQYLDAVMGWYDRLKAAAPTTGGQPYTGGGSGLGSVFGGQSYGISQGIGPGNNFMDYGYGIGLGVGNSHPGIDISSPRGTKTYFPGMGGVTGIVRTAGGSGYFCDAYGCGPGKGELRIELSNGDIIIFGHMGSIAVQPGQTITQGTYLGATGQAGSGPHLHLEYRKRSGQCSSGYCAIDPRNVIGF